MQLKWGKTEIFFYFQVCHGKGSSRDSSQTDAARRALLLLADSGDNLNQETEETEPENSVEFLNGLSKDEIPVVSAHLTKPESEKD